MTDRSDDLTKIATELLAHAAPSADVEVFAVRGADSEVVVHAGEVESVIVSASAGVGIRVVDRYGRTGFSWASSLQAHEVQDALEVAERNCRNANPNPQAALPHPDGVTAGVVELDIAVEPEDLRARVASALELDTLLSGLDRRVRTVKSVRRGDAWAESVTVSSTGIRAASSRSSCFLSTYVIAEDNGETAHGLGSSMARTPTELRIEAAATQAVTGALSQLGAVTVRSGRYVVLFEPAATASLLGLVATAFTSTPSASTTLGLLADVSEPIAPAGVRLVDDPTDPAAFGAARFDGEGLATRSTTLIENGEMAGRLLDSRAAQTLGTVSNGGAVRAGYQSRPRAGARALRLTGPPGTAAGPPEHDLVITHLAGFDGGVSARTGQLSLKATGVAAPGGAGAYPVRDLFLVATVSDLLASIVWVGPPEPVWPGTAMGNRMVVDAVAITGG
jgi:PmbA protein